MTREEERKAEREEMKRLQIAINIAVKDIKPVDTSNVVLKNAPPTKAYLENLKKNSR
jgi:hypothetical protein